METSRVAFSISPLKVNTAKHLLEQAGIATFVIDKTDSAYSGLFGSIEVYVDAAYEEEAKRILDEYDVFEEE